MLSSDFFPQCVASLEERGFTTEIAKSDCFDLEELYDVLSTTSNYQVCHNKTLADSKKYFQVYD